MWKNWFPFRRKEEKKPDASAGSTEIQKNGKENGTKDTVIKRSGVHGDRTGVVHKTPVPPRSKTQAKDSVHSREPATLSDSDRLPMPGSQARSPFTRRVSYVESNDLKGRGSVPPKPSVMNPAGPLLTTPLLPKIKRALEMNDSFSGRASSPLTRNRVMRSASLSYGPTHPTKSTPGRLPKVCLQRRPSLHLMNNRNTQSPSTVKVAPPDPTLLAGPRDQFSRQIELSSGRHQQDRTASPPWALVRSLTSAHEDLCSPVECVFRTALPQHGRIWGLNFRMSQTLSASPVKAVVDTQAVVSALRERSCRKRSTATVTEDSMVDEEFTQMPKRRRQDSHGPVAPPASIPSVTGVAPDLARQHERYTALHSIQQAANKRPLLPTRRASFDDDGSVVSIEQSTPKRERRHNNSRILSSLSSSARMADLDPNKGQVRAENQHGGPSGKRPHSQSIGSAHQDNDQPTKKVYPQPTASTNAGGSASKQPSKTDSSSSGEPATAEKDKDKTDLQSSSDLKEPNTNTPKKTMLLSVLDQANRNRASSLTHQAAKPVMMASPSDLEQDRRAEDERRVQDMLAFLDDEEDSNTDTTSKLFTPVTQTATTTATPASLSTTISTTAAPTSSSTSISSSTTTTTSASSLSQLLAAPLLPVSSQSTTKASSASLFPMSSLTKSTAPSPPSSLSAGFGSAAGNVAGLVQSSGASVSSGLVSSNPICSTGGAGYFSISTTTTTATAAPVTSAVASGTSGLGSLSGTATPSSGNAAVSSSPSQYTFKPVFGVQASTATTAKDGVNPLSTNLVTTSTQQPAITVANPVPSLSSGFTFGPVASSTQQASVSTATSSGSSFSFGQSVTGATAPVATSTSTGFSFGLSGAASAGFSFGSPAIATSTENASAGFSLGMPTQATSSSLGQNTTAPFGQSTQQSTATLFGQNTQQSTASPFGQSTQQNTVVPFGQNTQQNTLAPFGQNTQQNTAAPFGQNTQLSTAFTAGDANKSLQPKNLFGAPKPSTGSSASLALSSSGGFSAFGATSPPGQSSFRQSTTTAASAGFSFGAVSSAGGGGFSFGQPAGGFGTAASSSIPTAATTVATLGFGNTTNSASSGVLSFGQKQTAPTFSFGQGQPPQATASPFSFGQASSTIAPGVTSPFGGLASTNAPTTTAVNNAGFSFGAPSIATTAPSGGFNFGAAATSPAAAPGAFSFGGPGAFGQAKPAQSQQPAPFGSSTSSGSGFNFGMAQPQQPSAVPGFGSPAQATAPAFGAAQPQQSVPAFGGFGNNLPAASAGFSFGSAATPAKPAPIFGAGTPQAAPAFGGTVAATGPAFGATQQPSSGTPVFGASANQNAPAISGTAPGGAFSFTAGQKNFAFGAPQNPVASPGTGGFSFGQPNTGGGGFDFSASLGGTPQFNFGAGGGTGGAGNMFIPGASSTAPKPRAAARRAQRRGAKK